jgi:hypothetical protein
VWQKLSSRQYRGAWTAAAALLALTVLLAFPPARALAVDFLSLFRVSVKKVTPEEFNPSNLAMSGDSIHLASLLADNVVVTEQGKSQDVADATEATREAGIAVRLPSALENQKYIHLQSGAHIELNVDLEHLRRLTEAMDRNDIAFPQALDGATIQVDIPRAVITAYGNCIHPDATNYSTHDQNGAPIHERDCTLLLQLATPTISAPPSLDANLIGQSYLQLLGMSAEEAASFSRNAAWTTTLVVPIPQDKVTHAEVQVDSVPATLIQQEITNNRRNYVLTWVNDGILYALIGHGDRADALTIATSLQ